jgi:hypothetical protein
MLWRGLKDQTWAVTSSGNISTTTLYLSFNFKVNIMRKATTTDVLVSNWSDEWTVACVNGENVLLKSKEETLKVNSYFSCRRNVLSKYYTILRKYLFRKSSFLLIKGKRYIREEHEFAILQYWKYSQYHMPGRHSLPFQAEYEDSSLLLNLRTVQTHLPRCNN